MSSDRDRDRDGDSDGDGALVVRARAGDLAAFGELVRRHQHEARRVAAAIGGIDGADDCAQEAFVRAHRSLDRFRDGAPFRPWLLTIVVNVARNQGRSMTRWRRAGERTIDGRPASALAPSAEDEVLVGERRRRVAVALDALPDHHREVVVCRYLLELSERETAQVLDIPPGTVKSRLARALDRLAADVERTDG